MSRASAVVVVASVVVGSAVSGFAQSAGLPPALSQSATVTTVPRLIRVTSTFVPANGLPSSPVETVTLALYAEATGGAPLWQETQTVAVDADGRYSLLLGATLPEGLPQELFASGEARWLGRRFDRAGEREQARVLLASVPYALKASDADTLGGHPASAYLLAPPASTGEGRATTAATATSASSASSAPTASTQAILTGTPNFVAKYATTTDVGPSALFESNGLVGLGTTTPGDVFHIRFTNTTGSFTGLAVQNLGNTATSYSGMLFYDQNGALGQFQGFNNLTHEYRINNVAAGGSINFMIGGSSKFQVANNGNIVTNGQMTVLNSALNGLRVATGVAGGYVGSFGGIGEFDVDAPFITGGRLAVKESGNVGIGIPAPAQKLSVAGTIETTSGGIKFPDGSIQDTAAPTVYTTQTLVQSDLLSTVVSPMIHLTVPNGTYLVEASLTVVNFNADLVTNNTRWVVCNFDPSASDGADSIPGNVSYATLARHAVLTVSSGAINLECVVGGLGPNPTNVSANAGRLTAMKLAGVVVQ